MAIANLGCNLPNLFRGKYMTAKQMENQELDSLAIGRYLIGFPKGAIAANWYQRILGFGELTVCKGVTKAEVEKLAQERAAHFQAKPHHAGGTLLNRVRKLNIQDSYAVIYWDLDYGKKSEKTYIKCDDFILKDHVLYRFKGIVAANLKGQDGRYGALESLCSGLRSRRNDEISLEPGSCFDSTILVDGPESPTSDHITASVLWPDRPDVRFHVTTFPNGHHPDPPLLTRLQRANAITRSGVLRSGPRTIAGNAGEEHLERVRERNGTTGHLFIWEAQGLPFRYDRPQLRLSMMTGLGKGAPQNSSLSDDDALKLWDAVLASWRWRPTVPETHAEP
jgi:hypothetical protein